MYFTMESIARSMQRSYWHQTRGRIVAAFAALKNFFGKPMIKAGTVQEVQ